MSGITDIYDALVTKLATIYPSATYKKLNNPYVLEFNSDLHLRRGYGFSVGPATNTERLLSGAITVQREIVVVNTIVNRGTDLDITIRETAEKTLMEDQFLLIEEFEDSPGFVAQVSKMAFSSDNGIEFVFVEDQQNFLAIRSIFNLEYIERC